MSSNYEGIFPYEDCIPQVLMTPLNPAPLVLHYTDPILGGPGISKAIIKKL